MKKKILLGTSLFALAELPAYGEDAEFLFEAAVTSRVLDRGEQIAPSALEMFAGFETHLTDITLYAGTYGLLPFGHDRHLFDYEVDYTAGLVYEANAYVVDLSGSLLTYPGEATDSSYELSAHVQYVAPFSPEIMGFYDVTTEDYGVEVLAGPTWEGDIWTTRAMGRAGFVHLGGNAGDRSYAGAELHTYRAIRPDTEFGFFLRAEIADEDTFFAGERADRSLRMRNNGLAIGIQLASVL